MQDDIFFRIALLHEWADGNQETDEREYCKDYDVE